MLVFELIREQFPVIPAFCITINKSRGQTLNRVGIYLPDHCFTHGQLYVAMSRVTDEKNLLYQCMAISLEILCAKKFFHSQITF